MSEGRDHFETYAQDVIFDREKGFLASLLRALLRILSIVFEILVTARLYFYRKRLLREHNLGCLVISIGNLTWGGTGKTPVVERFARSLQDGGRRVAILSRGYKSEKPPFWKRLKMRLTGERLTVPPRVVSDGKSLLLDSLSSGDEPYMLAANLRDVIVIVDKDRVKAGLWAIEKYGVDTLLLDDGLQYLRLKHRLDIVLVDRNNPFGTRTMIPRGSLREPIRNLRRAHYIFITKCHNDQNESLIKQIRKHNKTAEIIQCAHSPRFLRNVFSEEELSIKELDGKFIAAFCGIATPESFENTLESLNARIELKKWFTDHHRYNEKEILTLINQCVDNGLKMIVTTEKDAVRLPNLRRTDVPIYFLRMEIDFLSGQETWVECVTRICTPEAVENVNRRLYL